MLGIGKKEEGRKKKEEKEEKEERGNESNVTCCFVCSMLNSFRFVALCDFLFVTSSFRPSVLFRCVGRLT